VHFVLLGHLYWRERGWHGAEGVVAVFHQAHIAIRLPTAPQYYENTIGVLYTKQAFALHVDSTMIHPGATLTLSGFSDLICSHRVNTLELCRDTRMRGCLVREARAWNTCMRGRKAPHACNSHFLCAYESMFTNLNALSELIHMVSKKRSLHIGFERIMNRVAVWLAVHQQKPAGPIANIQDASTMVLTLWETFDPRSVDGESSVEKSGVLHTLSRLGISDNMLQTTMSEWPFVEDMLMIL
jgi:hypothetical protein